MRKVLIYPILLSVLFFLECNTCLIYASPSSRLKEEKDARKEDKESYKNFKTTRKLLYEKMIQRTKDCKDSLDSLFFTVDSYRLKAHEAKDTKKEKEFVAILGDYNSVLGDIGLMQAILDMGKLIDAARFMQYYDFMESGYERLKDSFSLKNEIFLNKIDSLADEDALRYEKQLLRHYRTYVEYDLRLDKIDEIKDAKNIR